MIKRKTPQEIFDTSVTHLRKQGCKAENKNGKCVYRGAEGTKCAIGCLIADSEYKPAYDQGGSTITSLMLFKEIPLNLFNFFSKNKKLLIGLQKIHDSYDIENWENEFKQLAKKFNLKYESPK